MINKDIFNNITSIIENKIENLKTISSLSLKKSWNELFIFIKNNQQGLIIINFLISFPQFFLISFLIFIIILFTFLSFNFSTLETECPALNNQIIQDIITKICLLLKNILSEKNFFFLFLRNHSFLILNFLIIILFGFFFWSIFNSKKLEINVINQKLSLKNFLGKTIKSFSFYELINFYNLNIKDLPEMLFFDNYVIYPLQIKIIHKGNNKTIGKYITLINFYPAEFLEFIFKDIKKV
ncbi:MAG: hypothetical protein KatS3mg095_0524 [Candidatus Parcubacteria bacterium]|nr:MAG: hypothetical protein KatS3mg095_0524 [Candidatus Parcubacteria bacterium]